MPSATCPFGSYTLHDKRYDKHHFLIHDYFFAKTLDKVRPGGIVAFITSKGTLDKQNPSVRKYIAERAELIGAIRLPNNAFPRQRRDPGHHGHPLPPKAGEAGGREFARTRYAGLEWLHLGRTEDGVPVNQYFLDHPEMLLGQMAFDRSMYGNEKETTCTPLEGAEPCRLAGESRGEPPRRDTPPTKSGSGRTRRTVPSPPAPPCGISAIQW